MNAQKVTQTNYQNERLLFCRLYAMVLAEPVDMSEFDTDDLYALEVVERALRSDNEELRNLAKHMQAQRLKSMETITLQPPERLDRTWNLPILDPDHAAPPAIAADGEGVDGEAVDGEAVEPRLERQGTLARLNPQEILDLSTLQRLYRKQFTRTLDVNQFTADGPYGRRVLREAMAAGNQELVAAAHRCLDAMAAAKATKVTKLP